MGRKRRTSVHNVLQKDYNVIPYSEAWYNAFSRPERTGIWFVYGKPTNGKTAFTMQLTHELARIGMNVVYFSYEEGTGLTFQNSIRRFNWQDVQRNILIEDINDRFISFAKIDKWLESNRRVKVMVIDSIQRWDMKKKDISKLQQIAQTKLIVIISHVKDNGHPDGSVANELLRIASLKIWVEGFRAESKGRLYGPLKHYIIWPEGASTYYANNI